MSALRNFLFLITGFILVALAATAVLPARHVPTVSEKLARYAEAGDEFDVLAIGSSRTYRQIIPEVFDATAKAAGKQARLFNLGIDGMRPPEDTYVLEKALALRKKPLKLVLVECNNIRFELRPEDANTVRAVHWHDGKRLATMAQLAFFSDQKKRGFWDRMKRRTDTFPEFWEHAGYWFQNVTQLGRGNEVLSAHLFDTQLVRNPIGPDGFKDSPKRSGLSASELSRYEKEVEEMRKTPPRFDRSEWVSQAELEEKRRIIEKSGAKMVLVVPPYPMTKRFLPEDPAKQAAVLDFSNPVEFPDIYLPANRLDEGHTNRAGSEIYTRLIAERVIPHL
jgi:hypothetical protein